MLSSVSLHRALVCTKQGRVLLLEEQESSGAEASVSPEEAVLRRAAVVLMVASYRNQALHVFLRPALVAVTLATAPSRRKSE